MRNRKLIARALPPLAAALAAILLTRCGDSQIEANKQLVQQQQTQIEQMQQQIEALKAGQAAGYTPGVASNSTGCDKGVETTATQRGGERFAAGDFGKALGYYQDALTACPTDERAELNVARAYEALGDNASAVKHYRKVANANTVTVSNAQTQAQDALVRLQASRLP
ncbi:MAG: bacterial transcriptional activator domain-containing protein [Candidatus Binatus sp.]|uniref:tetratricopeptide repeat protein n=1 Tax=Candidatus Binatus sp. TaxID=2811406 RepID=UPI0027256815|nr:bacterial transcriptional activator domain-containing protein [Candidatus Binatus sp.]MDO8432723.1 bacterial transcriptional activator domain-containing protein [Candidatus Binatus sp.]